MRRRDRGQSWIGASLMLAALLAGGCKDSTSSSPDGGMDLSGLDLAGALTCRQLNDCERICKDTDCVALCRARAHPEALAKQVALQGCFDQHCPQLVDGGAGVCFLGAGGQFSEECTACINNTQVGSAGTCTPADAPECHSCVELATDCKVDR